MINGLKVQSLDVHVDDRGLLWEIVHNFDLVDGRFGQVYTVIDPVRGTTRAFHKHSVLWDYFAIVHGAAKFCFVDDRPSSPTYLESMTVVASARRPILITVPPGVHHGWRSLEDWTILISVGSELYDREDPDEERVPWDSFHHLFGDRNPFEIWAS